MTRLQLRHYHDLAASTKERGRGIGFAGVGIKLGLLACERVVTESRTAKQHVATEWHLKSRHKAPWNWVDPAGLIDARGTGVHLVVSNALSELLDEGFIEAVLRRHFQPLLERDFLSVLADYYPSGIAFRINERALDVGEAPRDAIQLAIRLPRKRKPAAAGYVFRSDAPLAEDSRGVAISTLGKVIKRGWDWLGMTPVGADRISGLIDAPTLADCLTLNKSDFLRTGPRGAMYLAFRKAIQEALGEPLAAWGESHAATEETRRRKARPLERDLRDVLGRMARDFPMLDALALRRPGGQRRLPFAGAAGRDESELLLPIVGKQEERDSHESDIPAAASSTAEQLPEKPRELDETDTRAQVGSGTGGRKRRAHLGLRIDFEQRPDEPTLGRLVESTIWVNEAHPAYQRALASRLQAYHLAVTVAMTLAPLVVEAHAVHEFVSAFLERWGKVDAKRH